MNENESTQNLVATVKAVLEVAVPRLPYSAPRLVHAHAFGGFQDGGMPIRDLTRRLLQTGSGDA